MFGATMIFATSERLKFSANEPPARTEARDSAMDTVATRETPEARTHAYTGSPKTQSSLAVSR